MTFDTLETERLILRKLSPEDFRFIFGTYSKEDAKEFLGLNSDEDYEKEKSKSDNGYASFNQTILYFQLIDKTSGKIIGGCGFHNWFFLHSRAELGYSMSNEDFKRKGLMSEALAMVIDYGFNQMNLHRIEALIGPDNVPSLKLMEKFNFTKEGVLREHYFVNNRFEDSVLFAKLVGEYKAGK